MNCIVEGLPRKSGTQMGMYFEALGRIVNGVNQTEVGVRREIVWLPLVDALRIFCLRLGARGSTLLVEVQLFSSFAGLLDADSFGVGQSGPRHRAAYSEMISIVRPSRPCDKG